MARTVKTVFEFVTRAQSGGAQAIRDGLERLASAADDFGDKAEDAGRQSAAAEGGIGKLGQAAKMAKVALAGMAMVGVGAITVAVGQAARDTVAASDAMTMFQARTGVANAEMQGYLETAQEIYALGLGGSIDEVATAMAETRQVTGASGDELAYMTEQAMRFNTVFGTDVGQAISTVDSVMDAWGVTSEEAFDILAKGMQETGDPELPATIEDIAQKAQMMGFEYSDVMAMIDTAQDLGLRKGTDFIAMLDSFGMKLDDNSAAQGLYNLRLGQMFWDYKRGEVSASDMFAAVQEGLGNIQNESQRTRIMEQIFGSKPTKAMEAAILGVEMTTEAFATARGTMEEVSETMDRSVSQTWKRFTATLRMSLSQALGPFIQKGLNVLIPLLNKLATKAPALLAIGAAVAGLALVAPVLAFLASGLGLLISPLGLIVALVAGLGLAFKKNFLGFGDFVRGIGEGLKNLFGDLKSAFDEKGLEGVLETLWGKIKQGAIDAVAWVKDSIVTPIVDAVKNIDWSEVPGQIEDILKRFASTVWDALVWIDTEIITPIEDELKKVDWSAVPGQIWDILVKFAEAYIDFSLWVGDEIIDPIIDELKKIDWASVPGQIGDILTAIASGVVDFLSWVKTNIVFPLVEKILSIDWKNFLGTLNNILSKIIEGLASGFVDFIVWVWDTIAKPIVDAVIAVDWVTELKDVGGKILDALKQGLGDIVDWVKKTFVDPIVNGIAGIPGKIKKKLLGGGDDGTDGDGGGGGGGGGGRGFGGERDAGGRGRARRPYLIGVGAQPELFVPDSPGTFYPRGQYSLVSAGAGAGGEGTVHNWAGATLNLYGVQDIEGLYRQLKQLERRKNI